MRFFTNDGQEEITLAAQTDAYHTNTGYAFWKLGEADNIDCLTISLRGSARSPYTVIGGVRVLIERIRNWRITERQLKRFARRKLPNDQLMFEPEYIEYMRNQRFACRIIGMRDGDIAYPGAIMHIIGPRWQVKRLGTMVANLLRLYSSPFTKAVRVRNAAGPLMVWDKEQGMAVPNPGPQAVLLGGELRRTNDSIGMDVSLYTMIAGFNGTSNEELELEYEDITAGGTTDHYFQMSALFPGEGGTREMLRQRMWQYAEAYPNYGAFLPDTSKDVYGNIDDAVDVLTEMRQNGNAYGYKIRLDSGNLAELYHYARSKLNAMKEKGILSKVDGSVVNLDDIELFPSGGIKALTIEALVRQGVPLEEIIAVGGEEKRRKLWLMVGEYLKHRMELSYHGGASESEVNAEFIDKLAAILLPVRESGEAPTIDELITNGYWAGRMKLAQGKLAYPGVLERLRMLDANGQYNGDVTVDTSRYEIPQDGILKAPLHSVWRYVSRDDIVVKDYVFPAGTRFIRPMQTLWHETEGEVAPESWKWQAMRDYLAETFACLPDKYKAVDNLHSNYGTGIEKELFDRAAVLADNDQIATEFLDRQMT